MGGARLVIEGSARKLGFALAGCAVFTVLGAFLLQQGEWWGYVVIGFFGLGGAVLAAVTLWRGRPSLILDAEGFEFTAVLSRQKIAWSDVDAFYLADVSGAKMVGIEFSMAYDKLARTRAALRAFTGVEGAIADQYKISPEDLCKLLNEWLDRYSR